MSPLDEAFHDWADAHEGEQSCYACFVGGWEARQAELDALTARHELEAAFWERRVGYLETERDLLMTTLASAESERSAFKRQRDDLARALVEATQP